MLFDIIKRSFNYFIEKRKNKPLETFSKLKYGKMKHDFKSKAKN